jgi:hypothetical protein
VDAQTPAQITAQGHFAASGAFLAATDAGFRRRPVLARTGAVNMSNTAGKINGYKSNITVLNPNFAYSAAAVTAIRPRATDLGGNNLAATGIHQAMALYDHLGNPL